MDTPRRPSQIKLFFYSKLLKMLEKIGSKMLANSSKTADFGSGRSRRLKPVRPSGSLAIGERKGGCKLHPVAWRKVDVEMRQRLFVDLLRNFRNSLARWRGRHSPMNLPVATSSAANNVVVP